VQLFTINNQLECYTDDHWSTPHNYQLFRDPLISGAGACTPLARSRGCRSREGSPLTGASQAAAALPGAAVRARAGLRLLPGRAGLLPVGREGGPRWQEPPGAARENPWAGPGLVILRGTASAAVLRLGLSHRSTNAMAHPASLAPRTRIAPLPRDPGTPAEPAASSSRGRHLTSS